ncbi:MAG: hypothetical protein H0W02_16030 [Ktedonobacteraceae bacterium]|nr:hypothetical protein [Ktedonobacteraceae bacterium]
MSWTPLAERFAALPLILSGPLLRRVEPTAVTVWLALKEPCVVTLRVYAKNEAGDLIEHCEGTRQSVRLGDHLHILAVTAHTGAGAPLSWGKLYYYDLFFQRQDRTASAGTADAETTAHLATPGILSTGPAQDDPLHLLVYPGHPLPSFVLPPEDLNLLRVVHGSCRKPHGSGCEMLSALDTILASAIQQERDRPQQLFLTGDQIYADDVAAPLLFALIDAGHFLFTGNEEEVLPVVSVPARTLGPGTRGTLVHSHAMLTSTTPHNHLLALSEYIAMYLFVWSDVLWPGDLPDAQEIWAAYPQARPSGNQSEKQEAVYIVQAEQLNTFRAALPQVRRALAHIATYTICDDHDVTDDWFLDGAWCQQVLASALGRQIVRNGLLAYALFQGWGNTPQQFEEANGVALLDAVDTWRGAAADARVDMIEELLGLPAAFSGSGTLTHSARALHWYHTYEGPRYQVILMDTRTQRFYRSPHDFPGLLSSDAVHVQIVPATCRNAEVTIIVSATPVLGVDFIESIQVWSHTFVKENYAYDCEAWALEWQSFQHFLKTVSALKRVVFLSGDVHYAFGSSMEYWDQQTQASAKFVDYTSSSFSNEGAGAHIAMLAIGYPHLQHLLRHQGTPTMDFFAWDISPSDRQVFNTVRALIWQRIYLFWRAIPRLLALRRSPYEIVLPMHGWAQGAFRRCAPDRIYRLRYLPNTLALVAQRKRDRLRQRSTSWTLRVLRLALGGITFLETSVMRGARSLLWKEERIEQSIGMPEQPGRRLVYETTQGTNRLGRQLAKPRNKLVAALQRRAAWLSNQKAGQLIIGYNNLGEIHFTWTAEKHLVMQRLWYHPDDAQRLLKIDYQETLELPTSTAVPPLP